MRVADRSSLKAWVLQALREVGGTGTIVEVCKIVWRDHHEELEASGDLFFTWQYDIRWAAQHLRNHGFLAPAVRGSNAPWSLSNLGRTIPPDTAAAATVRR